MRRPFLILAVALCLGVLIAKKAPFTFYLFYLVTLFVLITIALCINKENIFNFLLIFVFFLLGVLCSLSYRTLPINHISNFIYSKEDILLGGTIDSDISFKSNYLTFVIKTDSIKADNRSHSVCGRVMVRVKNSNKIDAKRFFYGDRLAIEGKFYKQAYFKNAGMPSYLEYLRNQGISAVFSVKKAKKLSSKPLNLFVYFSYKLRQKIKIIMNRYLTPQTASLLNAMILGIREDLPNSLKERLVKSGTAHVIAISGLHLTMVSFIILFLLKFLRFPRRIRYVLAIFLVIIYCLLTGSNVPAVRATIMIVVLLLGYAFNRQPDIINLVSIAGIIILFTNPFQLFQAGFQLSFMAVLSIIFLGPKIEAIFSNLNKSKPLQTAAKLFSASLAAWIGLLPLIAFHFRIISPVAILANVIVVPYLGLVISCAFVFILAALVSPVLAGVFSPSVEVSVSLLIRIIDLLACIPFGYFRLPFCST